MKSQICIYEDVSYKNLLPLVYFRPVYDLKCGFLTLRKKILNNYKNTDVVLHCRKYLENTLKESGESYAINAFDKKPTLFINGRVLADGRISKKIPLNGTDKIFTNSGIVVAARLSVENLSKLDSGKNDFFDFESLKNIPVEEVDVKLINYPWDLINHNALELIADIKKVKIPCHSKSGNKFKGVHFINSKNIFIDKKVDIKPNVVLDAESGPIFIAKCVRILPNVYIQGPVYIGENSLVKSNTSIYHNTTIGEMCKVGGEIENSIIHSYSNKQHEGFLGHSYLCSWINIGASTNNSDLKNNYGNITVLLNGEPVDSGSQFVGLMMGDHSKSAINTMFNTGTIIGVSSNIFGAGFPKRYLPSFTFGGTDIIRTNSLNKSIEVAEIVMGRRNIKMSESDKELFRTVFELTNQERM